VFAKKAPVAQSDRATDFESDSSIFHNSRNHDENRAKASQTTFFAILSIDGNSA
jgi:hypothetical protein